MRRTVPLLLLALAASACGGSTTTGGGGTSSPTPSATAHGGATCSPTGEVEIEAEDITFDKTCLASKAGAAFTVKFKNRDEGIQHNLAIFRDAAMTDNLFRSEFVTGKKDVTFNVPALAKGTYHFHCDIHPVMEGTFIAA